MRAHAFNNDAPPPADIRARCRSSSHRPSFDPWLAKVTIKTYGGKPVCNLDRAEAFAEIVIVDEFRRDGWDSRWLDRTRYWSAMYEFKELPDEQREFVADLLRRAGSRGGAWDVIAWREDSIRFAEAKRRQRDSIRESQRAFLEAALDTGLDLGSFMIVE